MLNHYYLKSKVSKTMLNNFGLIIRSLKIKRKFCFMGKSFHITLLKITSDKTQNLFFIEMIKKNKINVFKK